MKRKLRAMALIPAAAALTACPTPVGPNPDMTPPSVNLTVDATTLHAEASDASGVGLELFVDKNKDGAYDASERIGEASASANGTATLDVVVGSLSGLNPNTTYTARAIAVDASPAANEATDDESFTTDGSPDIIGPYSPSITGSPGSEFGQLDLEILINGDDISEQATQAVSGIAETKLYAMPIAADFTKSDLETYGVLLDTLLDGSGTLVTKTYALPSNASDYVVYSLSKDVAGNETLDAEGLFRTQGPAVPLGHRFLGSIADYVSGDITIIGIVGDKREVIGSYTPAADGTINFDVYHYVQGETIALEYDGDEQAFTYDRGELNIVNF